MQRSKKKMAEILLVEDNQEDVFLTRQCFKQSDLQVNLQHVNNGAKCLSYLRQENDYAQAPAPDLILLDLNMPVMSGQEMLEEMVQDDALRHLPVVVLTTSAMQADILTMSKLRCSAYVVKPVDFNEFQKAVQSIVDFWFKVAALPTPA
jgi:two-component system, chemotaxis family, response regulator Rcp1